MFRFVIYYFVLVSVAFKSNAREGRIINGDFVGDVTFQGGSVVKVENLGEYPYVVSMETKYPNSNPYQFCGGVLIRANRVLTAAHCLKGKEANSLQVRAGHLISTFEEDGAQVRAVASFDMHPKYNSTTHINNDIAFVKLQKPFDLIKFVQPIKLPEVGQEFPNQIVTSLGWGITETNHASPFLKKAEFIALSNYECEKRYYHDGDQTKICLVNQDGKNQNICNGDSGGPVVLHYARNPSNDVLVGIHSYTTKSKDLCDINHNVVANVPYLMHWINYHLTH